MLFVQIPPRKTLTELREGPVPEWEDVRADFAAPTLWSLSLRKKAWPLKRLQNPVAIRSWCTEEQSKKRSCQKLRLPDGINSLKSVESALKKVNKKKSNPYYMLNMDILMINALNLLQNNINIQIKNN